MLDNSHVGLMDERVIREATRLDDVRTYLNHEKLIELWPRLFLPIEVRRAWEASSLRLGRAA
ncbi:hypothetical protein FE391_16175 [Nonomuraea sp. KC401]|uniref:hypothetical protein n=1 Tax=unclassified Nonomuraea TaxID=2593643 RepID=UPI0010FDFFBD|nr:MULTISPECIES: hypothetical protein [unclassified Nonomuraea]TLF72796.1 hypothetical protein FE391_16175 [Nonomuraea sp. KC401]